MFQQVLLAPVPCLHLHSAISVPKLANRVAFASSQRAVPHLPIGIPVFICASDPKSATPEALKLLRPGYVTWAGRLGAIVEAVKDGPRSGKHPDPSVRPPTAEAKDTPVLYFWEVAGLHRLVTPRRLGEFQSTLNGDAPQWPVLAEADC
jgi:hypothetical protein